MSLELVGAADAARLFVAVRTWHLGVLRSDVRLFSDGSNSAGVPFIITLLV